MVILLRGRVQPGRRRDLVRFLRDAVPCYERPGGILTRLLRDVNDPDAFVEVVEYADRGTYERDQERVASDPEMRGYLERWHDLLTDAPVVETYEELTAEIHTVGCSRPHAGPAAECRVAWTRVRSAADLAAPQPRRLPPAALRRPPR